MATLKTKYVKIGMTGGLSNGNDWTNAYSNINQINIQMSASWGLVTAGQKLLVYVDHSALASATARFTATTGWVTDTGSHGITIQGISDCYALAAPTIISSAGIPFYVPVDTIKNLTLRNLHIRSINDYLAMRLDMTGGKALIEKCRIDKVGQATTGVYGLVRFNHFLSAGDCKVVNTVLDAANRGLLVFSNDGTLTATGGVVVYNSIIARAASAAIDTNTQCMLKVRNSIFYANSGIAGTVYMISSDYNASTQNDLTGQAASRMSQSFAMVDAVNGDFRLLHSDAAAKGYGESLAADPVYPFSEDIRGGQRGTTWDIGPCQVSPYTETVTVGKYIYKGTIPVEEGVSPIVYQQPLANEWLYKGYEAVATGYTGPVTATKTADHHILWFKGLAVIDLLGAKTTVPDHGIFSFKGYPPIDFLWSEIFYPRAGLVSLLTKEGVGNYGKTKLVERGCLFMFTGYEPTNYQIRATALPNKGVLRFRGLEAKGYKAPARGDATAQIFHFKGHSPEANANQRTKTVVSGVLSLIGELPQGNAPEVNAPVVCGLLSLVGTEAKAINGEITTANLSLLHLKGYPPTAVIQKWTAVPAHGVLSLVGVPVGGNSKARKTTVVAKLQIVGYAVAESTGRWKPVRPDAKKSSAWTKVVGDS